MRLAKPGALLSTGMRRRLHLVVLPVAAFLGVLPLLLHGCSCGHDFDFHLISWLDAAQQISHGNLHPHWAYSPAFGAGEPRFVFYPPLSWTIGALLTLLLKHLPHVSPDRAFAFVPVLYTWIALCSAGLSMHALLRRYASPGVALVAATLYLSNPYTLFTAYERTAFAELLAATWIPLLLLAILPHPVDHNPPTPSSSTISIPLLALAIALLWLTNAPAAVMGCYTVALIAVLRLSATYRLHRTVHVLITPAAHFVAGTSLGLALAAFYIVPAASERRWVQIGMATIPSLRVADNIPFHHTGDAAHNAVLQTVGIIALLLFAITAVALSCAWTLKHRSHRPIPAEFRLLAIVTCAIAILLTPISLPLWRYAPELAFLQFPWRFLAILAAVMALAVALALRAHPLRVPLATALSLVLAAALSFGAYANFAQACDPTDTPQAQLALFQSGGGTEPTDEYTPVTADNDSLQPGDAPFALLPPVSGSNIAAASSSASGPAPQHLDLNLSAPRQLLLNLRDYPAWLVTNNGLAIAERIARDDGLIAFTLPAGHSHIGLSYRATVDDRIGDAISAVSLGIFAPLSCIAIRRRRRLRANSRTAR